MAKFPHEGVTTAQVIDELFRHHNNEIHSELEELARIGIAEIFRGQSRKQPHIPSSQLDFFLQEYGVRQIFAIREQGPTGSKWLHKNVVDLTLADARIILEQHKPKRQQTSQFAELARMIHDAEGLGAKDNDKLVDVLIDHKAATA